MVNDPKIIYRVHATLRMAERGISRAEVEEVIARGETIENYPEDKPYPSRLMLATVQGRPIHAVVAWNEQDREWIVITVYEPSPTEWDPEFRRRTR